MPQEQIIDAPVEEVQPQPKKKLSKQDKGLLESQREQAELAKELEDVQNAVIDGILRQSRDSVHELVKRDDSVIQKVRETTLEKLLPAMGDLMATRLKNFCDKVDLDHPSIQSLLSRGFQTDSEFNGTLREIMTLLSIDNSMSMTRVLGLLKESFTKSKAMKDIRVSIYKPRIRSLAKGEDREAARAQKSTKEVSMKEWLEKAKGWDDHPSSFRQFTRLNDSHVDAIALNDKKSAKMQTLGMTALAMSFKKRNTIINNFLGEQYSGFVRIKMIDAAIIVAKLHNANFKEDYRSISFPRRVFARSPFWLEPDSTYPAKNLDPGADPDKEHKVTVQACMIPEIFSFKPRAYPLHEFKVDMPDHVKDVIEAVESHPDMLGKALFDQFWVIVPGVSLAPEMHNYANKWVIRTGNKCELHSTAEAAEKSLDLHITRDGAIHPVLLGEKDGVCYFLTLWG